MLLHNVHLNDRLLPTTSNDIQTCSSLALLGEKKEMNSKMSDMFYMCIVQDEKNQIITTNVWLNLVSNNKERHVDPLDQRK